MQKKVCAGHVLLIVLFSFPVTSKAQDPITLIIKEGIKKVIVAMDLKIQRLQNKTIWLQNAQKVVENTMSKMKLDEISDWIEKQRTLYKDYFDELWKVKASIATYSRIKEMIEKQTQLVGEYKSAYALFLQDKNFSPEELDYMHVVYDGILTESLKNVDQVYNVIQAFTLQISDAGRLQIINHAADGIDENLADLRQFNKQNKMLSLQRAAGTSEIERVKKLYGL